MADTAQPDATQQMDTLTPERSLRISGQVVTVRPFGFMEGLRLHAITAPIVNDMAALAEAGAGAEAETDLDDLGALFAAHEDALVSLMALSAGQSEAWVRGLDDADGQALLMLFWVVNRDFFTRRLLSRALVRRAAQARPASSPH